jgi:hypothetical protein
LALAENVYVILPPPFFVPVSHLKDQQVMRKDESEANFFPNEIETIRQEEKEKKLEMINSYFYKFPDAH